jgi:thiol-disulfide isomerase/thioredoxin
LIDPSPSPSGERQGWGHARRSLLLAAASLALPRAHAQSRLEYLPPGTKLPAWQALDFDGKSTSVPLTGKPTVVNFWATWCVPCRTEMPLLQQMADFYSDKLVLQAVNFKERAVAVQRHVRNSNWTVPVLLDPMGAGAQAWGVKVFPTTIGFDAQGVARWRLVGEYDWTTAEAGKLVEGLWR